MFACHILKVNYKGVNRIVSMSLFKFTDSFYFLKKKILNSIFRWCKCKKISSVLLQNDFDKEKRKLSILMWNKSNHSSSYISLFKYSEIILLTGSVRVKRQTLHQLGTSLPSRCSSFRTGGHEFFPSGPGGCQNQSCCWPRGLCPEG